jgi:hypothetical protein
VVPTVGFVGARPTLPQPVAVAATPTPSATPTPTPSATPTPTPSATPTPNLPEPTVASVAGGQEGTVLAQPTVHTAAQQEGTVLAPPTAHAAPKQEETVQAPQTVQSIPSEPPVPPNDEDATLLKPADAP